MFHKKRGKYRKRIEKTSTVFKNRTKIEIVMKRGLNKYVFVLLSIEDKFN